jgi:hypothetical protein
MVLFAKKDKKKLTLEEVTSKLSGLKIPLSLVSTPVNLQQEKKKFFDSDTYNPRFKYRIVRNRNAEILKELLEVEEIVDVDPRISEFYVELIQDKKLANDLMHAVGQNDLFTELSMKKFVMPRDRLFRNACMVLRGNYKNYNVVDTTKLKKVEGLSYNEISDVFKAVFEELGLDEWGVEKSKNISSNGVKTAIKKQRVYLDPNIKKTPLEVKKTVVHEITHVLRAYNGERSGFKALGKPNLNTYLDIEEGLAMWNEENLGYLKDSDLKERASVVYALYIGKDLSFRHLYNILRSVCLRNQAFKVAYLVKRGLGDTALPGLSVKPVVYFRGFRRMRNKLASDASLYNKLYAGKIDFKQTVWVDEGLIKGASIVPTVKNFENAFKKAGI